MSSSSSSSSGSLSSNSPANHPSSAQRRAQMYSSKTTPKKTLTPSRNHGSSSCFTAAMQDKQARNKDNYSSDSSSDEGSPWGSGSGRNAKKDTWETSARRREAATILDSPELLMMHAQARFDSIPGTRNYFTKLMCGYLPDNEPYTSFTPDIAAGESRGAGSGSASKRRVSGRTSLGGGGVHRRGMHGHDASAVAEDGDEEDGESGDGDEDEEMDDN